MRWTSTHHAILVSTLSTLVVMAGNPAVGVSQTTERAQLLGALVKKGDDARPTNPGLAEQTYKLALRFEPTNKAIASKITGNFATPVAMMDIVPRIIGNSTVEKLRSWAVDRDPAMDLVMLRMLVDKQLVGSGLYAEFNVEQFPLSVFVAAPSMPPLRSWAAAGERSR